jgi:two-component system, response regulator RegA
VDLRLCGRSGLEVIRDLKALDEATLVIVVTGYGSMETALESLRLGAACYLHKPVDVDQVLAAIDAACALSLPLPHREHCDNTPQANAAVSAAE